MSKEFVVLLKSTMIVNLNNFSLYNFYFSGNNSHVL